MYWDLVSFVLGEEAPYPTAATLTPSASQQARAIDLLKSHGLEQDQYVLLCPFSGADDHERRKVWPHFSELGIALSKAGIRVVVCPGPGEEDRAKQVLPDAVRMTGTDLGVYAALLAGARTVVANDTGPGHLAAAVGASLIALYGPHSVLAWAPLSARVRLFASRTGWPTAEEIVTCTLQNALAQS
jgi:heptosyltransferase-2